MCEENSKLDPARLEGNQVGGSATIAIVDDGSSHVRDHSL